MRASVAFIVVFAAACGGEAGEWSGTVEALPGGGRLVRNPAAGVWESRDGAGWRLEPPKACPAGQGCEAAAAALVSYLL